jgi:hypothetical protein
MNSSLYQRSPDSEHPAGDMSAFDPSTSESLADSRSGTDPVTSSPGETPYEGSHDPNYDPEHTPDRNVPEDGPSGENTTNNGEQGGGLWTSGGTVTTGTPYHDEDESN